MNTPSSAPPPAPLGRIVSLVLVLVIIGLAIGLVPRWLARQKLLTETRADFTPSVDTIFPVPAKTYEGTPLPAEVPEACSPDPPQAPASARGTRSCP